MHPRCHKVPPQVITPGQPPTSWQPVRGGAPLSGQQWAGGRALDADLRGSAQIAEGRAATILMFSRGPRPGLEAAHLGRGSSSSALAGGLAAELVSQSET